METPTVGQTSGFRSRDIHTKFPTQSVDPNFVDTPTHIGVFNPKFETVELNSIKKEVKKYKFIKPVYRPQNCNKCGSPMQLYVREKGDIETGKGVKVGYTCNRGGTGCQNAKAKKHTRAQIVKASLTRTLNPKVKHIDGVKLHDTMIHA